MSQKISLLCYDDSCRHNRTINLNRMLYYIRRLNNEISHPLVIVNHIYVLPQFERFVFSQELLSKTSIERLTNFFNFVFIRR